MQRLQHLNAATQLGTARGGGERGGPHLLHNLLPLLIAPLLTARRLAEEAELITRLGAIVTIPAVEAGTKARWQASSVSRAAARTRAHVTRLALPPWRAVARAVDALAVAVAAVGAASTLTARAPPAAVALTHTRLRVADPMV